MKKILFAILTVLIFYSCSTDFEINADWKDVTVVYGLLDQSDTVHYIKIGKAFLGDESALIMAQEPDSLYYDTANISAYLHELNVGNLVRVINLEPDFSLPKDSGIFFNNFQVIYKTNEYLNEDYEYRLYIEKSNETEKITAVTPIVKDFLVEKPNLLLFNIDFNFTDNQFGPDIIKFKTADNAKFYEVQIRFYYTEIDKLNPLNKELKYVEWFLEQKEDEDASGGSIIYSFSYDGDAENDTNQILSDGGDFFKFVAAVIDENANVNRLAEYIDIEISAGGEDLYTYVEVNKPSIGIVQDRPEFSNIDPDDISTGIFSTRYNKVISEIPLDDQTIKDLACGVYTNHLNFAWYQITGAANGLDTLYYPNCE